MKRIIFTVLILPMLLLQVAAQYVQIPDANFRNYLLGSTACTPGCPAGTCGKRCCANNSRNQHKTALPLLQAGGRFF